MQHDKHVRRSSKARVSITLPVPAAAVNVKSLDVHDVHVAHKDLFCVPVLSCDFGQRASDSVVTNPTKPTILYDSLLGLASHQFIFCPADTIYMSSISVGLDQLVCSLFQCLICKFVTFLWVCCQGPVIKVCPSGNTRTFLAQQFGPWLQQHTKHPRTQRVASGDACRWV